MIEQRPTPRPTQRTTQSVAISDEPIIDVKAAGYFVGYLLRSMKRRRSIMTMTFLVTTGLVVGLCVVMPRVYKISTRILTHRSLAMNALTGGKEGGTPKDADNPTGGAVELIKSRENLENLMNDVKLQEVWEAKRSVLWKWKDKILYAVMGPPTEQDLHEMFLKMLDERITAGVDTDVVTMDVEWPDADIAMSLAEGAVARFRKLRHDMELSELIETVNILERNVESSRRSIEEAVARMQKIFNEKEREIEARGGSKSEHRKARKNKVVAIRRPVGADQADPAADDVKKNLAEKQATIASIKRNYEARVKKAEEDLANLRATLGPEHPDVIEARRNLESMSQMPPELVALQAEETKLAEKLGTMPTPSKEEPKVQVENRDAPADDSFDMVRVPVSDELYQELDTDPEIASIMAELKRKEDHHDELLGRLANARIASETQDVAFEYRYIMTAPPVYPKKPVKPNIPVMLGGGLVVALLLGIIFAVVADIMSKRVLESWQMERFFNLKVLGEIEEP